jgi:membrane protease YdiL (CAAX protease family)
MLQRKPIIWFLVIAFAISWTLFLIPLAFKGNPVTYSRAFLYCVSLGMWGPGIAAIVTTLFIAKRPFSDLRLNKLGMFRFYLIAWFLPPFLAALTVGLSALIGSGIFDPNLTTMKQIADQASKGTGQVVPVNILLFGQLAQGLLLGPMINVFFTMGEELGWRGFLLPKLLPIGQWKAIAISGLIWGFWHAPVIAQGYNFPQHPYWGILLMMFACMLLSVELSWLYLKTRSPWAAALAHGSINAWGGLPMVFLIPGFDTFFGGIILSLTGCIVLAAFIGFLVLIKQMPVKLPEEESAVSAPAAVGY